MQSLMQAAILEGEASILGPGGDHPLPLQHHQGALPQDRLQEAQQRLSPCSLPGTRPALVLLQRWCDQHARVIWLTVLLA